ncbi:restriction endonuclease [Flavobacterium sp. Leaf82]|uniref:very short patch repair endonuclease n=1 Tax=Flavobacterium sp. Leaf82 TaxID=1736238 RepID=UPI0006FB6D7F|nr:very short patch repair endonuclease [Flavobacterium sp. Leaf82]KQO20839.1 restriction endonuclease [Flavobacterium sp. Leaf82]
MDKFSKEVRSKIMRAIKSKNTKEEILLAKALWHEGYRYRKNNRSIYGKPDLTFTKYKIAIFVDGEFFHGFNWEEKKYQIKSNLEYWIPKIERNISRDKKVNQYLIENGWKVIRFWSNFVKKNLQDCILIIEKAIIDSKNEKL